MDDLEKNSINQFNKWALWYDKKPINYLEFYLANKAVIRSLNPKQNSSLLDIGFGTGILLHLLSCLNRNLKLFGIDISEEMYKKAKEKFASCSNVELTLGSAQKLPFKDDVFDYVTCVHSFHHHQDSEQSLEEMKRVTKPGGKVLIFELGLDGIIRRSFYRIENKRNNEGNVHRYTKPQMLALFKKVGFVNIEQKYHLYLDLISVGTKEHINT